MMKTPICETCTKTKTLCSGCEKKLLEGAISDHDIRISRLLSKFAEDHPSLEKADFYKALDFDKIVIVLTRGDVGLLIGKKGRVVTEISKELGKKIRIAEFSGDLRKTVNDIVIPARVDGINVIYKDGEEAYKVKFNRVEARKLPVDTQTLEKAFKKLFEKQVVVRVE